MSDGTKQEFVGILQENQRDMTAKQEGQKFQQFFCAIIASIGAMIIGSVLAWSSPAFPILKNENRTAPLHIDDDQSSWVAAWTPIGAFIGALPAGYVADKLGRKVTLIIFTIPFIGAWILTAVASNVYLLYVARFVSGIIMGLFCAVLPMYVTEIAEDSVRGTLGTLFQVFLTIGILADYILGLVDSYTILNIFCTAMTIVFFASLFFIPESPTYLMKKNRKGDAEKCLRRLRGPHYDINIELNSLRKSLESSQQQKISFEVICTRVNIKALAICTGLMFFQQFSGVNGIIFFAQNIFQDAKVTNAALYTVILGIVQTGATVASSVLIDKAGRKILLIISSIGMAIGLIALGCYFRAKDTGSDISGITWLPLCSLVGFIVVFSLGFGPIPWMMSGEVLASDIKSAGSGCTVAVNWGCVSIVTYFFQQLTKAISTAFTIWIFAGICAVSFVFVLVVVPETKGKSMQEIQNELAGIKTVKQANGNA